MQSQLAVYAEKFAIYRKDIHFALLINASTLNKDLRSNPEATLQKSRGRLGLNICLRCLLDQNRSDLAAKIEELTGRR